MILWQTYDGRLIEYERLSWQHLSNIHYYMNLIFPKYYEKEIRDGVRYTLFIKYGGILPYHPDPNFEYEKNLLKTLGYLNENDDIVVHGNKIGWYE